MTNVKVGDKIRLLTSGGYDECNPGDVMTVALVRENGTSVSAMHEKTSMLLYFYGTEYEVLTETQKFKVGDKVRVRSHLTCDGADYSWISGYGLNVGSETEVKSVDGRFIVRGLYEGDADWPVTCQPSLFEQVPAKETELERLVRVANEGFKAADRIYSMGLQDQLECGADNKEYRSIISVQRSPGWNYRIKPKPAFEPFRVGGSPDGGPMWLVKLEGDTLHVGCKTFGAEWAKHALKGVQEGQSDYVSALGSLKPTRTGIRVGQYELSWADCDRILAALEKAGVK